VCVKHLGFKKWGLKREREAPRVVVAELEALPAVHEAGASVATDDAANVHATHLVGVAWWWRDWSARVAFLAVGGAFAALAIQSFLGFVAHVSSSDLGVATQSGLYKCKRSRAS